MYFVIQKKHTANGNWDNNVHVKETRDEAFHQFHAFMSTYGYGQVNTLDYVACSVEADSGSVIFGPEIDDRRATEV